MSWQSEHPKGAVYVPADQRRALRGMLAEMSIHRLEVTLAPSEKEPDSGGKIRVVMDKNADWYQRMCADYPSTRKRIKRAPDTAIKREHTITALERVLTSQWAVGFYQTTILKYIHGFVKDQQAQKEAHKRALYEQKLERKREARRSQREAFDPASF